MEQEKTSENMENKPARDANGRLLPGHTANPNGRPPGAGISIVTELKRKLNDVPPGQKQTYLQLLVERILKEAIVEGNDSQIKNILQYVEGMPKQHIEGSFKHTWFEELKENLGINTADLDDDHFRDVDLDDVSEETLSVSETHSETDS